MLDSQAKHGEPHFFPSVELSANKIGDLGCKMLAKLVNKNHTITTLALSSNLITDKGLGYIVEAVSTPRTVLINANKFGTKTNESTHLGERASFKSLS